MTETGSPLPLLSRYAIMIDVGYIYASAGELLFSAASRREYRVDADKLIQALTRHAEDQVRGELLRVYWYDAARDRVPTIDQRVIAQMPWVKLRLGNLNAPGSRRALTRRSARTWRRSPGTARSPTPSWWRATRTWSPRWRPPRRSACGCTCG